MCMTLILDYWETISLTAGCNLYSTYFRLCVLTVRSADQPTFKKDTNMYFRERDKPVIDTETFLTTTLPKFLIAALIIFLNLLAIITMFRSNKWISQGNRKGFYILPESTQGLLHSLFVAYLALGLLTLYSQISLSTFVLGDYRIFEDQGKECLTVNSLIIALSVAISLHLLSLAVDRTLACYLPWAKYSSLSKGTVPLWLLAIWLPSTLLGSLPLAGWKTNFSFCIFLHQFEDDYLRFVSGFYMTNLFLMPCLYFFFVAMLKPQRDPRILYRWHRKLQAHHRLTFAIVMAVNIICWTPFHVYLLSACQTCPFAYLGDGFTLEYLYMIALIPSLLIPLMFSIRSSVVDKCANKISRCVHFRDEFESTNHNPLAKKSPLFFIDDYNNVQEYGNSHSNTNTYSSVNSNKSNRGSSSSTTKTSTFFVPHYLPNHNNNSKFDCGMSNGLVRKVPLRNFCAYLNKGYGNSNGSITNLSSDSKYGFPIIPSSDPSKTNGGIPVSTNGGN